MSQEKDNNVSTEETTSEVEQKLPGKVVRTYTEVPLIHDNATRAPKVFGLSKEQFESLLLEGEDD